MNILITGGTGLVGTRLLPRLANADVSVRALIRAGKPLPHGIEPIEGDLFDAESLARATRDVSAVVHLAAVFRTPDTDLIWKSNVEGTRNLIAAVQANAPNARFIMTSTSNVYSRDNPHPGRESDPVKPVQAYPASKVEAENAVRSSGLNWSILRLPFIYGEGDGHLEMLPQHLDALGFQPAHRLSTLHHQDVAHAVELALKGVFDGLTVNLADDAPLTVYELVELVGGTMASTAEPTSAPWFQQVSSALARSRGFTPTVRTVRQAVEEGRL